MLLALLGVKTAFLRTIGCCKIIDSDGPWKQVVLKNKTNKRFFMQNHRHKLKEKGDDTEVGLLISLKTMQLRENRNQMTNVGNGA